MITKKTVFILGAGTSIPYGYPSGRELLEVIVPPPATPGSSRSSLEKSSLPSVDFFLEKQPDFINLGKVSIATIIMSLEDPKKLYNFKLREKGIYHYLYNQMVSGCKEISEFGNNKISFITFNYDRSLESFLVFLVMR